MNKRRKIIFALGAGALALPFPSFAQPQGKVWRVGFLTLRNRPASIETDYLGAFPKGMRELGYVEGKNLVIEWRFAENKAESLPVMAAELVKLKVDVIVVAGSNAVDAAKKATTSIPIVMGNIIDPIGSGFVASLARPGGNITGLSNLGVDLGPKHFEMLMQIAPRVSRVAVLKNPLNPSSSTFIDGIQATASKRGVSVLLFEARNPPEIDAAFAAMFRGKVGALIVARDVVFNQQARQLAELSLKHKLPSIYAIGEFAEAGGLISYGTSNFEQYRRAATYVDKILKGAKPADLPVEQPTKFELVINGKTAKALGLKIPQSLLLSADKVIE